MLMMFLYFLFFFFFRSLSRGRSFFVIQIHQWVFVIPNKEIRHSEWGGLPVTFLILRVIFINICRVGVREPLNLPAHATVLCSLL